MAPPVKVLVPKAGNLSPLLGPIWLEERADSCVLSPALHLHTASPLHAQKSPCLRELCNQNHHYNAVGHLIGLYTSHDQLCFYVLIYPNQNNLGKQSAQAFPELTL